MAITVLESFEANDTTRPYVGDLTWDFDSPSGSSLSRSTSNVTQGSYSWLITRSLGTSDQFYLTSPQNWSGYSSISIDHNLTTGGEDTLTFYIFDESFHSYYVVIDTAGALTTTINFADVLSVEPFFDFSTCTFGLIIGGSNSVYLDNLRAESGNSGTLSKTLDNVALSSTSKISISSTLSKTLDNATLSSDSNLVDFTTLSKTLDNATLSSTSKISISSTLSKTLDNIQVDIRSIKSGALSYALDNATLSSTASTLIQSDLSKTLNNATLSSASKISISSTLSKTLDNATLSSVVEQHILGICTSTLRDASLQSFGVPWLYRYGEFNTTLDSLACSSSEYIDISFNDYFVPVLGYEISHINVESTSPEIIYYSQNYASLYDTPETSLGSYGETPTFKVLYNIVCTFRNILDNNITYTEKKLFRTDIKPNWSAIRDTTLKNYFEGSLINNMTPAEFIDYMKSQGYYQ